MLPAPQAQSIMMALRAMTRATPSHLRIFVCTKKTCHHTPAVTECTPKLSPDYVPQTQKAEVLPPPSGRRPLKLVV
jgi:hypothetical protein